MRAGVMQPYFFPYLGYFSMIRQVDRYIVDDVVQYIHKGWMARNRMLKQGGGWQYIIIPAQKHEFSDPICKVKVDNGQQWREKICGQLSHYARAPHYQEVMTLLNSLFSQDFETISSFNVASIRTVCEYLGISTPIDVLSNLSLPGYCPPYPKGENALHVCLGLSGITEYWNPPGGKAFYDPSKYAAQGIQLCFQQILLEEYPQKKGQAFEPGLSILDVMMFNDVPQIMQMMDRYELI